MGSENTSGSGGRYGYGIRPRQLVPLFQKEPKCFTASDTCNGKIRPGSTESDLPNESSEMVRKKRCLENESLQKGSFGNREDEPRDEAIPSRTMEDEIQQIHRRRDNFTYEVLGLLEIGKAHFLDASMAFEEGIMPIHQKIIESWEEEIGGLRNVHVANEITCHRLCEARIVLEKLKDALRFRAVGQQFGNGVTMQVKCSALLQQSTVTEKRSQRQPRMRSQSERTAN